jgi:hypothetical protein
MGPVNKKFKIKTEGTQKSGKQLQQNLLQIEADRQKRR